MTYERVTSDVVQVTEAIGALIMIGGALVVLAQFAVGVGRRRVGGYTALRVGLARVSQVGLEVLILADVVRTIIVEPTLVETAVLATIVVIRILLGITLSMEVDGTVPWHRASAAGVAATRPAPAANGPVPSGQAPKRD